MNERPFEELRGLRQIPKTSAAKRIDHNLLRMSAMSQAGDCKENDPSAF